MPVYSIKNDETLAVKAFSTSAAAYDCDSKQQVFSTQDELYNTSLTDDQLRDVYYLVTGFETRVQYRDYLCELIFNAIVAADLPLTDVNEDTPLAVSVQTIDEDIGGDGGFDPEPPTISPEPPTPDPEPVSVDVILENMIPKTTDENRERLENAIVYGTSHPEIYDVEQTSKRKSERPLNRFLISRKQKKQFTLSPRPKTRYSIREKLIFDTIVDRYPDVLTTKDIIEIAFTTYGKFHVQNAVAVAIKSLTRKVEFNEEPFLVKTTSASGPKPMSVWIEVRE